MKKLLPVLALMLLIQPAFALTLAEKKQQQAWNEELATETAEFKTACGYDLPVTLDEAAVTPFMEQNTSASAYCGAVVNAMTDMCADATSKEAIAAKIKSLSCTYKKGEEKGAFSINGGALDFGFDVGTPNLEDATKSFLENNL